MYMYVPHSNLNIFTIYDTLVFEPVHVISNNVIF